MFTESPKANYKESPSKEGKKYIHANKKTRDKKR
jgi:hypothetical protein